MQPRHVTTGYVEGSDYGGVLRRRWWLVVIGVLVGVTLAFGYAQTAATSYESTTSVLVSPTDVATSTQIAGGRTTGTVDLDTEAQLVRSTKTAQAARDLLRTESDLTTLIDRVSVTVPPNTAVLAITYTAPTRPEARSGSHAFAQAYLENRAAAARADVAAQAKSLRSQITSLSARLEDVTGKIAELPPNSPDRTLAIAQQSILVSQITALNQRLAPLQTANITPGDIISDASDPTPTTAPAIVLLLSGGLGGLLLGLAAAAAAERLGQRVRGAEDVTRLTSVPVLADLPKDAERTPADVRARDVWFDRLANHVVTVLGDGAVLLVAGAASETAGPAVANRLALALARHGYPVARLDELHPVEVGYGRPDQPDPLAPVVTPRAVPGRRWAPVDVLATADAARAEYRYVIVSAPSMADWADAQAVASNVDGTVLVAERGRTTRAQLADAIGQLTEVQADVVGVLLIPARLQAAAVVRALDGRPVDELADARLAAAHPAERAAGEPFGPGSGGDVAPAAIASGGGGTHARVLRDDASGGTATGR